MNTILIILGLVAVAAGVAIYLMKSGKIKDADGNLIPDAIEDKVEEVKAVAKEVKTRAKRVAKETKEVVEATKKVVKEAKASDLLNDPDVRAAYLGTGAGAH